MLRSLSVAVTIAVALVVGAIAACDGGTDANPSATQDASDGALSPCPPGVQCPPTCEGGIGQAKCPHLDDASAADSTSGTCQPADVSGYVPAYHHANAHRSACTQAEIDKAIACLFVSPPPDCASFFASDAGAACSACIFTKNGDPTYGPIVSNHGNTFANPAGCMELADPADGLSCAKASAAAEQCGQAACTANCPVVDDASYALYATCVRTAMANGCKQYADAARCADVEADGGPAARCFNAQDNESQFRAIAAVFCLAPSDGGADAGTD